MEDKMKCKNCNGEGGWEIAVSCSPEDTMWIDDGECMAFGYKECFWCKGTGKITKKRILEVKKNKKEIL